MDGLAAVARGSAAAATGAVTLSPIVGADNVSVVSSLEERKALLRLDLVSLSFERARAAALSAVSRADREAATPPAGAGDRPSLLVRALAYPDHAVQFAAATALLRSPVPVPGSAKPQIVEILRRAAATDPGPSGSASRRRR